MMKEWKKAILSEMNGCLRPHGFSKRGQIFERVAGEVTQIIPFYMYQSGLEEFNIGIEVTASARTFFVWLYGPDLPKYDWVCAELRLSLDIVEPTCRYASFKTSGRQWLITNGNSVIRAIESIISHLDSFGVPFLDQRFTIDSIAQTLSIRKLGYPYMTWFSPYMPTVRSDYIVDCYVGTVNPDRVSVMEYTQEVFRREPHRQGKVTIIDFKDRFPERG